MVSRLAEARAKTDALFQLIPNALYERPIAERHRIVFYIGHLEAFDWNLLRTHASLGLSSFNEKFDQLFAFGIDPVGDGLPTDQPSDWPGLREVAAYTAGIRERLDAALVDICPDLLLNVAIEHRLMHAETLAYMLHRLPLDSKVKGHAEPVIPAGVLRPGMVEVPAGPVTLGLARSSGVFGWDNEFEAHTVEVPAFTVDRYMVSNGEYLQFMVAGGYQEQRYWAEGDWAWRVAENIGHPAFWTPAGNTWLYRTMFDEVPLPLDWPVYVSHAEASAYARWAGKQLPTEAQWQRAASGVEVSHGGNFDFTQWNPAPVHDFPESRSTFGVEGLLGNGWEWTRTLFEPFSGFQPFPFYPGYSADFFDGQHYVMKGGSSRTASCMLRPSFRNWFQPHYPYVYAGFRCVAP